MLTRLSIDNSIWSNNLNIDQFHFYRIKKYSYWSKLTLLYNNNFIRSNELGIDWIELLVLN